MDYITFLCKRNGLIFTKLLLIFQDLFHELHVSWHVLKCIHEGYIYVKFLKDNEKLGKLLLQLTFL